MIIIVNGVTHEVNSLSEFEELVGTDEFNYLFNERAMRGQEAFLEKIIKLILF